MWSAIALAFGLAMDATAVSAARGLGRRNPREVFILPLFFGGFQAGMSALGWLAGVWVGPYIAAWDNYVAFALLLLIGGKMVFDAVRGGEEEEAVDLDAEGRPVRVPMSLYFGLAIATSIDAAAAGLTLPLVPVDPWISLVLIGVVTAACSAIGYMAGQFIGKYLGNKLALVGGLVLIAIGVNILING